VTATPAAPSPHKPTPLVTVTVRGLLWTYASLAVSRGGALLTTIVLARLLTPTDFGVVAFAIVAIDLLSIGKDAGMGSALIQHQEEPSAAFDTAFTLNLLMACVLTVVCLALAPQIAIWFDEPAVGPLLRWMSLTFLLDASGFVHLVQLRRALAFRRKLSSDVIRTIVKVTVSVTAAMAGLGAGALVAGNLAASGAASLAAWYLVPWRPRLRIDRDRARALLRYGGRLAGSDALGVIEDRSELLIVGWMLGSAALGTYTVAGRAPALIANNLLWVTTGVLFPAYVTLREHPERLRGALLDTVRFSSMLYVPITLGLALTAGPLVSGVLGSQWESGTIVLQLLALSALPSALTFHMGDVLKSTGRTDLMLRITVLELVVLLPAMAVGAGFGLAGVAAARLLASLVAASARAVVSLRLVQAPRGAFAAALAPSAIAGTALAAAVALSGLLPIRSPLVRLAVMTTAGALAYGAVLWSRERQTILWLARRVSKRRSVPIGTEQER